VKVTKQTSARPGEQPERSLLAARLVLGSAFLSWSARAARRHDPAGGRTVAAVLGARHLAQALITVGRPGRAALALGAEVDAVHSASMIALGLLSGRWRAAALADALLAGSLAAAGTACARSRPEGDAGGPDTGPFAHWRDQCAEVLARYLTPSWLSGQKLPPSPSPIDDLLAEE